MKKYIILFAAAVVAMAACTKVEDNSTDREINFKVANRVQTRATGSVYENGAFGTYAWFTATSGSDHAPFMVNETVDKVGSVWKTTHNTFYWPKTGAVDFISYSPFSGTNNAADSNPAVTQTTIDYTGIEAGTVDYMYADKAKCSSNVNEVTDSDTADSGFSGVPTVFRHALAKLSFKVKANFIEYTDPTTNALTKWDVYVKSAKIGGFKTTGDLALTLNADGKSWDKPVTEIGDPADPDTVYVWDNLSGATLDQELVPDADLADTTKWVLLTTAPQDLSSAAGFVMPQVLTSDVQKIKLEVYIKTHLPNGFTIEENFSPVVDIKDISSLQAWEMNQNIVYTINIKPVAYYNDYDTPNDVIITFDPAVADWTEVSADATIQL